MATTSTTIAPTTTTTWANSSNVTALHGPVAHSDTAGAHVLFSIMITLLFGALMERSKSRNPVPFTISMIIWGGFIGGLSHASPDLRRELYVAELTPMTILNIFLPILIFDGSYNLKLATLMKVMFSSIVLAGPGVIINTFAMAGAAMAIYSTWTLPQALLFGAIVSATDPVAVIARLKDLDADRWTTTLTDGEAIINDGTAVVLFELLRGAVGRFAHVPGGGEIVVSVIRFCVVPIPLGIACGFLVSFCEHRSTTMPIIVTVMQLAGAYVTYFIATNLVVTSSVLTVMVQALYMSAKKAQVPKGDYEHPVKHFWECLVWIANALLFALVGLLAVHHGWRRDDVDQLPLMLLMYVVCNAVRGLMILVFWPVINWGVKRESERLNWRRWAMLTYGGLRGGIALVLGIAVLQDENTDESYTRACFDQVVGIVLLTSIINGWTAGPIVTWLGLDAKAEFQFHAIKQAVDEIRTTADVRFQEHKAHETHITCIDWGYVYNQTVERIALPTSNQLSYAPSNAEEEVADDDSDTAEMSLDGERLPPRGVPCCEPLDSTVAATATASVLAAAGGEPEAPAQAKDRAQARQQRMLRRLERSASAPVLIPILLRVLKRELWKMYDAALLAGNALTTLETFVESSFADSKLFTAEELHDFLCDEERFGGVYYWLKSKFVSIEESKENLIVAGCIAFARIMCSIESTITVLYGSGATTVGWTEWAKTTAAAAHDIAMKVRAEFPRVARVIDSRRVAREILHEAMEDVDSVARTTGLTGKQRGWLGDKLFRLTFSVASAPLPAMLTEDEMVRKTFDEGSVIHQCSEADRELLWAARTLGRAPAGEPLHVDDGSFALVILGRVEQLDAYTMRATSHVTGELFALSVCVRGVERRPSLRAESDVTFLAFPFAVLLDIMDRDRECRDRVYRRQTRMMVEPLLAEVHPTCELTQFQRRLLCDHAELVYIDEDGTTFNPDRPSGAAVPPRLYPPTSGAAGNASPQASSLVVGGSPSVNTKRTTTFLVRGSSPELRGPHCMSLLPHSFRTSWNRGTVLVVVHDLRLDARSVPVTGISFFDRAHVHIDVMLASLLLAPAETKLFACDHLLFALTEYVPCVLAVHSLIERSGALQTQSPEAAAAITDTLALVDGINEWLFLRHVGGISCADICGRLDRYFTDVVARARAWTPAVVAWANSNAGAAGNAQLSATWFESAFEVIDPAAAEAAARRHGFRFPFGKSAAALVKEGDVKCGSSSIKTILCG